MDFDELCNSARLAQRNDNIAHESDHKKKVAIALVLGRSDWLEELGLSIKDAIYLIGKSDVNIVAAAKIALQNERH